jgi:hypothetical protein
MLRAVGRATVSDLAIIVVVGASLAVGVYRCFEFVAIGVMVIAIAVGAAAVTSVGTAAVTAVTSAAVTSVRGCNMRSAQTKHDCERENCNRLYDFHDLLLLN